MRDDLKKAMNEVDVDGNKSQAERDEALKMAKDKARRALEDCDSFVMIAVKSINKGNEKGSGVTTTCTIQGFEHFKHIYTSLREWCSDTLDTIHRKMLED